MSEIAAKRRARQRAQTVGEIKQRAWSLLAKSGLESLSLREVARQMEMAPSALYRYFPSRNDLLTALIVEAFDSLADATSKAYDDVQTAELPSKVESFIEVSRAYRRWAITHRTEWALIFSSVIPDYNGTELTTAASVRVTATLTQVMADAAAAGEIDLDRIDAEIDDTMRAGLQTWAETDSITLPAPTLAACLWCYAALHGAIALDLNKHLPPALLDNEALFVTSLRAVLNHI
ncbi:MAG: TetR/AcrR family transcriptional regulator, partial [Jatrophihabitans sp.]